MQVSSDVKSRIFKYARQRRKRKWIAEALCVDAKVVAGVLAGRNLKKSIRESVGKYCAENGPQSVRSVQEYLAGTRRFGAEPISRVLRYLDGSRTIRFENGFIYTAEHED
jgi:hypothetical protein